MPFKTSESKLASNRRWRQRHKEERRVYNKQWRDCHPEYRLRRTEISSAYKLANQDKVRAQDRVYRLAHLDAYANKEANRRAMKKAAFVEEVDREVVFLNDAGICQWQYCQEASPFVDPNDWHLDHIIPLSKGGEHSYRNTQVTHPVCNLRKKDSYYGSI